jgi:hypothetical protein
MKNNKNNMMKNNEKHFFLKVTNSFTKGNEISPSIAPNKACKSISTQRPRKRRARETRSSKKIYS